MSYSRLLINHIAKILFVLAVLNVKISAQQDTTANNDSKDTVFVMQKSPWTAVLLSAVIPGAGQIYNESYWKAPVIWGISGWLIYNWVDLNKSYKHYGDLYEQTGNDYYKELRGNYRDERDLFTIYMILTYILNLVDAYVDAQLFDFNVDESIGKLQPEIRFRLKF